MFCRDGFFRDLVVSKTYALISSGKQQHRSSEFWYCIILTKILGTWLDDKSQQQKNV
jgi:hypothetical protein